MYPRVFTYCISKLFVEPNMVEVIVNIVFLQTLMTKRSLYMFNTATGFFPPQISAVD